MANWTVATAYKRFQQILEEEYELDFKVIDGDSVKLTDISEIFEKRIVRDAMGEAKPTPKKPKVERADA